MLMSARVQMPACRRKAWRFTLACHVKVYAVVAWGLTCYAYPQKHI